MLMYPQTEKDSIFNGTLQRQVCVLPTAAATGKTCAKHHSPQGALELCAAEIEAA